MFTYKNIVINFKITNFKNKFTIKTKILLLANTDQTLQTQICKKIIKNRQTTGSTTAWTPNI